MLLPINEQIMTKLRPSIATLLTELGVKYAAYKDEEVEFEYKDLKVSIKIKSKLKANEKKQ